jgi:radical SAM protein with 4Fe4S-binding SPASM domain
LSRLSTLSALLGTALCQPWTFAHLLAKKVRFRQRYGWVSQSHAATTDVPAPLVLKFLLTYRCNLRCKKCMLWGQSGWQSQPVDEASTEELDFALLARVLRDEASLRPSLIFSGGEPFLYSRVADLLTLLKDLRLHATFCTNGTRLAPVEDQLVGHPFVSLLVSLDGPQAVNDDLRGIGVYKTVTDRIKRLKSRAEPPYIGVQFTVRSENLGSMVQFCERMVDLGVDWILLNPPWFVTLQEAAGYATFSDRQFHTTAHSQTGYLGPCELDPEVFCRELARLRAKPWPIQISCYFKGPKEIWDYANSAGRPPGNDFCYKQWLRMDVLPSGQVTPCAQFPDIKLGDLKRQTLAEIWNGQDYARFRQSLKTGLLPVCTKCNALYLYDAGRILL